jgi:hypothetical protein
MGGTNYIDFLQPEDLTAPLMRGVDIFNRPFLSMRTSVDYSTGSRTAVHTIFQRYRDDANLWVCASAANDWLLHESVRAIADAPLKWKQNLQTLLSTGTVTQQRRQGTFVNTRLV